MYLQFIIQACLSITVFVLEANVVTDKFQIKI
jgi:hypothetical protein